MEFDDFPTTSAFTATSSLAEIAEKAIIDNIVQEVKAVNVSHFCGGTLRVADRLKLYIDKASTSGNDAADEDCGGASWVKFPPAPMALETLIAACKPATFGRGSKDTYDLTYRQALQLGTDNFSVNWDPHGPLLAEIVESLARKDCEVVPQLYKLNVYGPGGHFKAHVDTPRGASMFGSLVVCLPSNHTGGQLILTQDGKRKVFDWGEEDSKSPGLVRWAAFYSDVQHEILPVTDGYRITLTYNLHWAAKRGGLLSGDKARAHTENPVVEMIGRALSQPGFFLDGCVLGFCLQHEYPITNDGWSKCPDRKGSDSVLCEAIHALHLEVDVTPVYTVELPYHDRDKSKKRKCIRPYGSSYIIDRYNDGTVLLVADTFKAASDWYQCGENDEPGSDCEEYDDRSKYAILVEDNGARVREDVVWCVYPTKFSKASSYTAYGNEAHTSCLYVAAALLVTIPPWSERQRKAKE
ncbi:hypothetical protein HK101_007882 [Irineochytrium annulatum]|nr:hypothetical protein HK101_007882 [Irineochytrium annulatum]